MLYALTHPARTVRWWRYRIGYVLAARRQALTARVATARAVRRIRRDLAQRTREAEVRHAL